MMEWHNFPEERPEKDGKYLVVYQGRSVEITMYLNGHFRMFGENQDWLITHWMPLPEIQRRADNG